MKKLESDSDIGGVLIGTKRFMANMTNGAGDGTTEILIVEKGEIDLSEYKYNTSVKGKFNIYAYDCSNGDDEDIIAKLKGRYGVYYCDGTVVFEKWAEKY